MEIKKEKRPKYETKKVKVGYEEKEVYIANDGKKFDKKDDCKNHEISLLDIQKAKQVITKLNFGDNDIAVAHIAFDVYSEGRYFEFFKFRVADEQKEVELQQMYLTLLKCNHISLNELYKHKGCEVIICSYEEETYNNGTYYYTEIISKENFIESITEFSKTVNEVFN